ncbi:GNAT family N-acetyltransferase [Candidatus Woesebacteria bacterium]|nr:GNAT family N-acetyltransferase [Candidatus Woesebacteria bacterium]
MTDTLTELKIREYHSNDYDCVCNLMDSLQMHFVQVDSMKESRRFSSKEEARTYIDQGMKDVKEMNGACFVAEIRSEVIGFIQGIVTDHANEVMHNLGHKPGIDGWIGLLIVDSKYRGRGIGKKLIERIKHYFQEKKCSSIRLKVMVDNSDTVKMYEKIGFRPREMEMVYQLHEE